MKRFIMLCADLVAVPCCLLVSALIVGTGYVAWSVPAAVVATAIILLGMWLSGIYRSIVRFMGPELLFVAIRSVSYASVALYLLSMTTVQSYSLGHIAAFWLSGVLYIIGSRTLVRLFLQSGRSSGDRVVIYGAGEAGIRLASAISGRGEYTVFAFVDDNQALHGSIINKLPVYSPDRMEWLVGQCGVQRVLLALPSASRRKRQRVINQLERLPVHVQTMPDLNNLILGQAHVDDIREVDIEDLLGRDVVAPIQELLGTHITGRSVMVTGAGGSIGSELSLQILQQEPKLLILLDMSEAALYSVDQQLQDARKQSAIATRIVTLIGSTHHEMRVENVMKAYSVDTIYHAAAYKHVPMVEHNMLEGVHNNVFGTLHLARAAINAGVSSFVLISTDKAVKPTNVMGATKRFAELILQALDRESSVTRFSMVRFGNVLASSGSVVPRFREQIRNGGPVTVTHPEIYRYFMTIPEAASLVLQAGSMASGGEVFVLDMGEPVRIVDLAEKMIHLMGMTVCNENNPDGDIEIEFTGLRPAEKMYEELLIGTDVSGTRHPRILQARESSLPWEELDSMLKLLWAACQRNDCAEARTLLLEGVTGYSPTARIEDLVWRQVYDRNGMEQSVGRAANVTRLDPRRGPAGSTKAGS